MTPLTLTLKNNLSEIVRSAKAIETHGEAVAGRRNGSRASTLRLTSYR